MAGNRQHQIVMLRIHHIDIRANPLPERLKLRDFARGCAFGRGQDAPAIVEQRRESSLGPAAFGARNRMGRNDDPAGKGCGQGSDHTGLG